MRFVFTANVIAIMSSQVSELIRGVYKSGEEIIRMPFGIIAKCVQFVQFSITIVRRVKMERRKHDSTGEASKQKKSKEKVKEVTKRPLK